MRQDYYKLWSAMFSVTNIFKPYPRKRDEGTDHELCDHQCMFTDAMKLASTVSATSGSFAY